MRDDWLRRSVKMLTRWQFTVDLAVTRLFRRSRGNIPYRLAGSCNRCGACCETPAIQVHRLLYHSDIFRRTFLRWQNVVNGFTLIEEDRGDHTFVFHCTHYDPEAKGCDSYSSRPGMCRDYPKFLLEAANPVFPDTCGFRPVSRNAKRLRDALASLDLTPEQREKLDKGLNIRDDD
jgi:uncharacterized protein